MTEVVEHSQIEEIVKNWKLGVKFDEEGYEDLGFTLQQNAIEEAVKLSPNERQKIADLLFPVKLYGN